jgi:hypothetical protein
VQRGVWSVIRFYQLGLDSSAKADVPDLTEEEEDEKKEEKEEEKSSDDSEGSEEKKDEL